MSNNIFGPPFMSCFGRQCSSSLFLSPILLNAVNGTTITSVNWSDWDGTKDGDTQYFYDDGDNHGPTHLTPFGPDSFVALHRHYTTPQSRKFGVYSVADKVITEDSTIDITGITGSEGIFPSMPRVKMSADRVLGGIFGSGGSIIILMSKSGTTLAQLDLDDFSTLSTTNRNYRSIERLTATTAVLFYSEASGVSYKSVIIDISGDTISFGTPVATGGSTTVSRYGALSAISETGFIVAYDTTAYLYSVSGSTITLEDSIDVRSDSNAMLDVNGSAVVRDGLMGIVYEYGATNQLQLIEFTASALTRGQSLQIQAAGSFDGPQEHGICSDGQGTILAAICTLSATGTDVYRIDVAEDGTPTNAGIMVHIDGDHPTLRMLEGNAAAILTSQWTDGESDNQIVMKVLSNSGEVNVANFSPILMFESWNADTLPDPGPEVDQWDDQSGNALHATQIVEADQPSTGTETQNGVNVVEFSNDGLDLPDLSSYFDGSQNRTIIAAMRADAGVYNSFCSMGPNTNFQRFTFQSHNQVLSVAFQGSIFNSTFDVSGWSIVVARLDGTTVKDVDLYQSGGTPQAHPSNSNVINTDASQKTHIGGQSGFSGAIAALYAFNRAITDEEMNIICGKLRDKLALTWEDI